MKYLVASLVLVSMCAALPQSVAAAVPAAAQAPAGTDGLAAKVKAQIDADAEFKDSQIDVTAAGGEVTLKGVASTAVSRVKLVEKVKAVEGVTKVVNKVTIAKPKK